MLPLPVFLLIHFISSFCNSVLIDQNTTHHVITGSGLPSALQFNVTGSFFGTTASLGCSVMRGVRYCAIKQEKRKKSSDIIRNMNLI